MADENTKWEAMARDYDIMDEAVPYLFKELESHLWTHRWKVVNVLGFVGDPRAIPVLADRVLHDPENHVRWRSLWAVRECEWEGEQSRAIFREALEGPDTRWHWNAAIGLSFFGDSKGLDHIHNALKVALEWRRWEAVNALGRVHDERTAALLEPLVRSDPSIRVRQECVVALGGICDEKAKEILVGALQDPDPALRWRAADGLGRCGDPAFVERLEARAEIEENERVLSRIALAIERLQDPDAGDRQRAYMKEELQQEVELLREEMKDE
jgi:HEAT repeat protein